MDTRKGWKNPKKELKKCFKNSILYKYQSLTHVSTSIVQGLFKNIVFRSVALVIKKLWAFLGFCLHRPDFTDMYPTLCIKKFKPFNFLFIKSQKLHGYSAKNDSARATKLEGEGRLTPRPSPLQGWIYFFQAEAEDSADVAEPFYMIDNAKFEMVNSKVTFPFFSYKVLFYLFICLI